MNQTVVSADWLKQHLNDGDLIVLNASPQSNMAGKKALDSTICLPKSRHFNIKKNFTNKESSFPNTVPSEQQFEKECRKLGINRSSKIVVYDNLGIYTSPRVWWLFKMMGHENIAVLNGGLPEWIKKGYETVRQENEDFGLGDFHAHCQKQLVKTYQEILDNILSNDFQLVDARSKGRFEGTAQEPRKHLKSGHIPNSVNIPYQDLIENGKFKSHEVLHEIFSVTCNHSKNLIFSCGSGMTACIVMLACEIAFKQSRLLYDGSWTEWAELQNLKVSDYNGLR